MAIKDWQIKEFKGLDQSSSQNQLNEAYSPDCVNMDTIGGELRVANGYTKAIATPIPGALRVQRIYAWRVLGQIIYVAVASENSSFENTGSEIYVYLGTTWTKVYTYNRFTAVGVPDAAYLAGDELYFKYFVESGSDGIAVAGDLPAIAYGKATFTRPAKAPTFEYHPGESDTLGTVTMDNYLRFANRVQSAVTDSATFVLKNTPSASEAAYLVKGNQLLFGTSLGTILSYDSETKAVTLTEPVTQDADAIVLASGPGTTMAQLVPLTTEAYDGTPESYLDFTGEGSDKVYSGTWDFLETRIGEFDYLIISNGVTEIVKLKVVPVGNYISSVVASPFGSWDKASRERVSYLTLHYSRLFSAGDPYNPSRLYWSCPPGDERSIEDWSLDSASSDTSGGFLDLGDTDGDQITALMSLSNQLLVFKRNSIYRLLGDRPSNYRIYRVNDYTEEIVDSGVVKYRDVPFWLTDQGVNYFDGQNDQRLGGRNNLRTLLETASLSTMRSCQCKDRLYWTYRTGDGNIDNGIIVYDAKAKTFMLRRGFTVRDITSKNNALYMVNDNRYIYVFDSGDDYDGQPIDAHWTTPESDFGQKAVIKHPERIYMRGAGWAKVTVICGLESKEYVAALPSDYLEIPIIQNSGRTIQLKISNVDGGSLKLTGGLEMDFSYERRP